MTPRVRKLSAAPVGEYWSPEQDLSLADEIAMLSPEEQEEALAGLDMENLQYDFSFWGRPSQLAAVNSDAWMTVCLAGRGFGKSRILSEAIHKYAMTHPGARLLLLGRTTSDVRDVMIFGDSGVMSVIDPRERPEYKPAVRKLLWENEAFALCYSAERPDALRGMQIEAAFCDEIGSYRQNPGTGLMNAFDQVKVATRLSSSPRIFVATTPRRVPIIIDLVEQARQDPSKVKLIRGSTMANKHLSPAYLEVIQGMYAGTALGRQELDGELLTDVEGALLAQETIDDNRREDLANTDFWKTLPYRVVGVDPSVSSRPGDECGIVVAGATGERKLYQRQAFVLEDASVQGSPDVWANKVVQLARKYNALVVAEQNQGGELVRMVIQGIDARVPVLLVHAKVSKMHRAEPVGACYERGAVHHVDWFPDLEAQLTSWAPDQGMGSPDRLDACVAKGTLITMGDGSELPIEQVRVGDRVLTRKGPRKVLAAQMTNPSTKVYEITEAGEGRTLLATANHPVWSESRQTFVRTDALLDDMLLTCVKSEKTLHHKLSSTEVSSTNDPSTRKLSALIGSTMSPREAQLVDRPCIETSIKTPSDRFPRAFTSITRITTPSTTTRATCLLFLLLSTLISTRKLQKHVINDGLTMSSPRRRLKNGPIRRLRNGLVGQLRRVGRVKSQSIGPVHSVEQLSPRDTQLLKFFVDTLVVKLGMMPMMSWWPESVFGVRRSFKSSPDAGKRAVAMHVEEPVVNTCVKRTLSSVGTKTSLTPALASGVEHHLSFVQILPEPCVLRPVGHTVSKQHFENVEVWNLEIDETHEYFANGILTHNCVYALGALLLEPPKGFMGRITVSSNPSEHTLRDVIGHDPYAEAAGVKTTPQNEERIREFLETDSAFMKPSEPEIPDSFRKAQPYHRQLALPAGSSFARSRGNPYASPSKQIGS